MINKRINKYCKECNKIENYDLAVNDTTQVWECHHRLETHFSDGSKRPLNARLSIKELKGLDMYWNRPANELIFLTKEEHFKLHRTTGYTGTSDENYKIYQKAYYENNIDARKAYKKRHYESNKDKMKAYYKEHKEEHREERKTYQRVRDWAKYHNFPSPEEIPFPKKWTKIDKDEYLRQYSLFTKNENKRKIK